MVIAVQDGVLGAVEGVTAAPGRCASRQLRRGNDVAAIHCYAGMGRDECVGKEAVPNGKDVLLL